MAITSVSPISFKGQESAQTNQKQKGGAGKAVASFFIPGLGEFLDGRNKEGAIFLGSRLAAGAASAAVSSSLITDAFQKTAKALEAESVENAIQIAKPNKALRFLAPVLGLASLGLTIANVVDAYKGGKDNKVDTQA